VIWSLRLPFLGPDYLLGGQRSPRSPCPLFTFVLAFCRRSDVSDGPSCSLSLNVPPDFDARSAFRQLRVHALAFSRSLFAMDHCPRR
jgi:hypothetical protein